MRTRFASLLLALMLLVCKEISAQQALTNSLPITFPRTSLAQFVHRRWGTEQGLPQNSAQSIAKNPLSSKKQSKTKSSVNSTKKASSSSSTPSKKVHFQTFFSISYGKI
jgi:hypothetical protein